MNTIILSDVFFTPYKRIINRNGRVLKLRNKESELLSLLCAHYPESISREEIEIKLWEGSYVTDNTLTQTISNLRNALDDTAHELVITIPKKGYRIGVKPEILKNDDDQPQPQLHDDKLIKKPSSYKSMFSFFKETNFIYLSNLIILGGICFSIFFHIITEKYKAKLVDVGVLPMLINFNDVKDAPFLLIYQQPAYILLKKRNDGGYIACERQGNELICEKE